jgi:antitoxin component of MazEF toxin-antitoxin module
MYLAKVRAMIMQKLRRTGNSYVVTIPKEAVERRGFSEGQLLAVELQPLEVRPVLSQEVADAFEASWRRNEQGYRYLAGR